jgi:CheY-like chemotaxis protein
MLPIKSILLLDNNYIDNFINRKILENYGATNIIIFTSADKALSYLNKTTIHYQFILTDIHLPVMDGFEFIDKLHELDLHKKQGKIGVLSASVNPEDKEKSNNRNAKFIEKPLTIEKLFAE